MDLNKKRALVVDDDQDSRLLFVRFLEVSGFATATARDGEDALDILSLDPYFDLIITDVMMPYMSGFELTARLKAMNSTKNIPVIVTSAFHDWNKARANNEAIADGFVSKPIVTAELAKEIARVLEKFSPARDRIGREP
jgi:CheY-like chemotaxis protein